MRLFLISTLVSLTALAQTATQPAPIPGKHIPAPVLMELRALENQFDLSLGRDCAPEKCISKGCVYQDHAVVDMPRNASLPGLGQTEGPGSVPIQEYLTIAHCDFAHEKSVSPRDVAALVKRLEQRLAKGWLQVTVGHQILEPISESLRDSPPPPPVVEPVKPKEPVAASPPPPKWDAEVALRELWVALLPHFSWMAAIGLLTAATLMIIWALRRLGSQTLEEKAMLAQLNAGTLTGAPAAEDPAEKKEEEAKTDGLSLEDQANAAFVAEQHTQWGSRFDKADLAKDDSVVVELLREWLRAGEFPLLAKAIFTFGDRLSVAFPSDGEYAVRKVEFAEYLRSLDRTMLPSDSAFYRQLSQHAIAASLNAQSDAGIYLSLREEFGSAGIASLIERLPERHGALLFGLVPSDVQDEVARALPADVRLETARQLLLTNRISREERGHLFEAIDAARAGLALPLTPPASDNDVIDRGREFDAAGALSMLLPFIDAKDRRSLFLTAYQRSNGALPHWYESILYPDMLLKVPSELQADMLLEVDVKGLAGWSSLQSPAWQEHFLAALSPSLQNALRASMAFRSRADQLNAARKGQAELVASVKKLVTQGKVTFSEIVA